jgi:hypothetical protein
MKLLMTMETKYVKIVNLHVKLVKIQPPNVPYVKLTKDTYTKALVYTHALMDIMLMKTKSIVFHVNLPVLLAAA